MGKLVNLFSWNRRRMEGDLDRELRDHVERRVTDLTGTGLSEVEARRRAAIEFGSVVQVQEEVRETWIWAWFDTVTRDIRTALRGLAKAPMFALGAGAVLALGIGANTAIFSVVNSVLLKPLAYPNAERIIAIGMLNPDTGRKEEEVSGGDFLAWQAQNEVFEAMAHCNGEDDIATVVAGRAEFANLRFVSPDFFAIFKLPPSAGRLLPRTEQTTTAVVSREWAETHFGTADSAVGKTITVYGIPLEIVGVAAPGFHYPEQTDIWAPAARANPSHAARYYQAIAKLKAGVSLATARAQMQTIGGRLARQYPEDRFTTVDLTSLQEHITGNVRLTLWMLMGAVSVVLLIACANIANLQLGRCSARTHEIALRTALGAARTRVVGQLLIESFVLTGLAAIAGVLLAYGTIRGLAIFAPPGLERVAQGSIDGTALLFALGLTFVVTVLSGLLPAMIVSRHDISNALKQGGSKGVVSASGGRLRSGLAVAEVALSLMLLVAAGLLLRSFQALHNVDLGFTTQRVLAAYTQYVVRNEQDIATRIAFYRELLQRVRNMPGVIAASGAAFLPLGKEIRPRLDYFIEGKPQPPPGIRPKCEYQAITPDYFQTFRIPLRGRDFDERDTMGRPAVAIINESLAREAFPNESPIGHRIRSQRDRDWMEIIGVAAGARWRDPYQPPPPELFAASMQGSGGSLSVFVRTSRRDDELANALRKILGDLDPTVPIHFETVDRMFTESLAYPRFRAQLISAFAGIAAVLAALGLFSVLAYLVEQRTRELAVRRAVGAQASDLIRLIAGHGLRLVTIGLVLGLISGLAVARLLGRLLFEISPWDMRTYIGAAALLGMAAFLGILFPALRVIRIDPLIALRYE